MATDDDYDQVIAESAKVLRPDGKPLFVLLKKAMAVPEIAPAWSALRSFNNKSENRGTSTGVKQIRVKKKDGTISRTHRVNPKDAVISGVIGFYDRYPRIPYCRKCAWNMETPGKFQRCLPLFQQINGIHKKFCPEEYAAQKLFVDKTHPDFVIPGTVYSTVTVNKNYRTAYHLDGKNQAGGFSGMLLIRDGSIKGGLVVFPEYRTAVEMDTGDLIFFNGQSEWHGNTAIVPLTKKAQRCTLVFYFRSGMVDCLSAREELERAKRRKIGEKL